VCSDAGRWHVTTTSENAPDPFPGTTRLLPALVPLPRILVGAADAGARQRATLRRRPHAEIAKRSRCVMQLVHGARSLLFARMGDIRNVVHRRYARMPMRGGDGLPLAQCASHPRIRRRRDWSGRELRRQPAMLLGQTPRRNAARARPPASHCRIMTRSARPAASPLDGVSRNAAERSSFAEPGAPTLFEESELAGSGASKADAGASWCRDRLACQRSDSAA